MTKQIPQGYKQTKVGVIPESWKVVKLGDIATIQRGASPRPIADSKWFSETSKIGWVRISDVSRAKKFLNFTEQYVSDDGVKNSRYIEIGNIIMSICATIGKPIYTNIPVCIHDGFIVFTNLTSNKFFMYYYLQLNENKWYRYGQPGSQINLNTEIVNNETIALPPLKEQEKIADILTTWDNAITKQEQLIEQKRVFKKGIMQQIFSQKLRFKDDNGNDYPAWSNETLADVSDVRDGTHESPQYVEMGYPFITSKNLLENGNIDFINVNFISETDYNNFNKRSLVEISDILFGMIGTIGNPVIVKKTGFGIKNVALVKELQRLKNQYLIHYLRSYGAMKQFHQQNTGGTQKFIALGIIRQLTIKLPCIKEQNQIADLLTNIDDEITKQTEILEQLKLQKQSLMQKLLTGQVRVKI